MRRDLFKYVWIVFVIALLSRFFPSSFKGNYSKPSVDFTWESLAGVKFPDISDEYGNFSVTIDRFLKKDLWKKEKSSPVKDDKDRYRKEAMAVFFNDADYLSEILKPKDIKIFDKNGRNLLVWAIVNNCEKCVGLLLEKGSGVDFKDRSKRFPLDYAVMLGNMGVAGLIAGRMKEIDYSRYAFCIGAVLNGDLDYLNKNLTESNVDRRFKDGTTLLHWAAGVGNVGAVKLLLGKGAFVDSLGRYKETPLYVACYYGQTGAVEALLSAGAKTYYADEDGNTPLHVAAKRGYLEVVKLLVEAGADLNEKNRFGETPLDLAVDSRHKEVVDFLVEKGAKSKILEKLKKKNKSEDIGLEELEKSPELKEIMKTIKKITNKTN